MLIKSTWTLTTDETTVLPRTYGLQLVKELHERAGLSLGSEKIPSVAFSGIMGYYKVTGDFISFQPGEFYQISLSGLVEGAAKAIAHLNLSDSLEFLGAKFNVINREDDINSYEQLYTTLVANEPEPIREFRLTFQTSTAFAQGKLQLPLPVPGLMFRSWLQSWNEFAPIYLGGGELIGYLAEAIALKRHRIQTQPFRVQKGSVNGFIGEVTLHALYRTDPLLTNVANLLVNYSQFAGTGMKTRLGMGQTHISIVVSEEQHKIFQSYRSC